MLRHHADTKQFAICCLRFTAPRRTRVQDQRMSEQQCSSAGMLRQPRTTRVCTLRCGAGIAHSELVTIDDIAPLASRFTQ
jgi:hypothetical protein